LFLEYYFHITKTTTTDQTTRYPISVRKRGGF
jgi:hypothetical protein